jgi:protein-tyrosine phosphatase
MTADARRPRVSVLFVCMGNICRSPTAHGVFRKLVHESGLAEQIATDSAGTHAYHVGEAPDRRARATAERRGIDLSDLRARKATPDDFLAFDYVVAMDQDNYFALLEICPAGMQHKLQLFMDFAPQMRTREVPDPYYGGPTGFERVFDLVEAAAQGLLDDIRVRHL